MSAKQPTVYRMYVANTALSISQAAQKVEKYFSRLDALHRLLKQVRSFGVMSSLALGISCTGMLNTVAASETHVFFVDSLLDKVSTQLCSTAIYEIPEYTSTTELQLLSSLLFAPVTKHFTQSSESQTTLAKTSILDEGIAARICSKLPEIHTEAQRQEAISTTLQYFQKIQQVLKDASSSDIQQDLIDAELTRIQYAAFTKNTSFDNLHALDISNLAQGRKTAVYRGQDIYAPRVRELASELSRHGLLHVVITASSSFEENLQDIDTRFQTVIPFSDARARVNPNKTQRIHVEPAASTKMTTLFLGYTLPETSTPTDLRTLKKLLDTFDTNENSWNSSISISSSQLLVMCQFRASKSAVVIPQILEYFSVERLIQYSQQSYASFQNTRPSDVFDPEISNFESQHRFHERFQQTAQEYRSKPSTAKFKLPTLLRQTFKIPHIVAYTSLDAALSKTTLQRMAFEAKLRMSAAEPKTTAFIESTGVETSSIRALQIPITISNVFITSLSEYFRLKLSWKIPESSADPQLIKKIYEVLLQNLPESETIFVSDVAIQDQQIVLQFFTAPTNEDVFLQTILSVIRQPLTEELLTQILANSPEATERLSREHLITLIENIYPTIYDEPASIQNVFYAPSVILEAKYDDICGFFTSCRREIEDL